MATSIATEIEEVKNFIGKSKHSGLKEWLGEYLTKLEAQIPPESQVPMDVEIPESKQTIPVLQTKPVIPVTSGSAFIPLTDFAWDQGSYNSPSITIYIDLPQVGNVKDNVDVKFGAHSIDLKVLDLNGKNYRLYKDNLEKDIIPHESKFIVKRDKIVLKLQKVKGEYSYESWTTLTAKKPRDTNKEAEKKSDPMGGIMDMMKEMYDEGDENMKKIIGEAMLKSKSGEKPSAPNFEDM